MLAFLLWVGATIDKRQPDGRTVVSCFSWFVGERKQPHAAFEGSFIRRATERHYKSLREKKPLNESTWPPVSSSICNIPCFFSASVLLLLLLPPPPQFALSLSLFLLSYSLLAVSPLFASRDTSREVSLQPPPPLNAVSKTTRLASELSLLFSKNCGVSFACWLS